MYWVDATSWDNPRRYLSFLVCFARLPAAKVRAAIVARLPVQLQHEVRWSKSAATLWVTTDEWPDGGDDDDVWDQLIAGCRRWVKGLPAPVFVYSGDQLAGFKLSRAALATVIVPHLTKLFRGGRIEPRDLVLLDNIAYFVAIRAVERPGPAIAHAIGELADAVIAANSKVGRKLWDSEVLAVIRPPQPRATKPRR